jgi:ATP-binding cassette subfamily F protein 3
MWPSRSRISITDRPSTGRKAIRTRAACNEREARPDRRVYLLGVTLVSLADITVRYGSNTILERVDLTVTAGERWGIVGRNGTGKTSLFRLITGEIEPARGTVFRQSGLRIALLDQLRDFGAARTVWDAAATGYRDLIALEHELERETERLGTLGHTATEADLARYGRVQERFQHAGGYEFKARVDAVLQGLGFDAEESKRRPLEGLSGGEQGRVGLAAQLAAPADLVLLDEPTNHLDLETTDWLRRYLGLFGETVIVISHDRAFLDDTVDHVLHVHGGTTTAYRGGYSSFVTQRAERLLTLERQLEQQRKYVAKEEEFIRRHIAGQNSTQARGRQRRLSRLPRLSPPPGEADAMTLRLEIAERSGDQVLVADRLTVAVGERILVRDFSGVVRRGDVVALAGPNGAGKTTLLATLLGAREAAGGSARLGGSVRAAWFRQDLAQLPEDRSCYECVARLRPAWTRGAIQSHLGCFGFSGEEVERSTAVLSGGERARMALALMTLDRANLLILDEPTNHLDVESIEVLEDALEEFDGTVILVSHDRAFLRELATRVWAFDGDRIEVFDGTFAEWEERRAAKAAAREAETRAAQAREAEAVKAERQRSASRAEQNAARAARRAVEALEQKVHQLEARASALEAELADPALYETAEGSRKAALLRARLEEARRDAEAAMARWVEAME